MNLKEIITMPVIWEPDFGKQLIEADFFTKEIPFSFNKDFSKEFSIFSLGFNADVKGKTTLFNDKEDKDELGNFTEAPFPAIGLNNAMLRYDLNIKLKEAVSGEFKKINMHFLSEQDVIISYYKIHSNSNVLQQALMQDVASFKTIYSEDEIFSLAANEGVAVKFNTTLDAGLNLAFSDVFSWTLAQLVRFLPKGTDIAGTSSAGAFFSFSVKIDDKFKLFIQKSEGDLYRVSINKAAAHSTFAALQAGISASIHETDDSFTEFMDQIFSALLGQAVEDVNHWVDQGISKLGALEKSLLTKVIKRLGIDAELLKDDALKTEYDNFKAKIIDKAKVILTKKLEVGIGYEYQKAVESGTVFNAEMTKQAVKENLRELLLFKLDKLEDKEGVKVTNYVFSAKQSITSKFGFRFTFGNFNAYWFNQKKSVFEESANHLQGTYRKSFSIQKSHLQGGVNQKQWYFNFSGEMKNSVENPKMDDFEFSSIVHWEDQESKTKPEELADFIEMGIIWNCINIPFDEACKNIYREIRDKKNVKFICEVKIPAPEMNLLIAQMAKSSINDLIHSLNSSMPRYSNKYRKELPNLLIYFSVWNFYLKNEGKGNAEVWASLCYEQLKGLFPDLAKWELSFKNGTTTIPGQQSIQSFVGLTEHSGLFDDINSLQKGIKNLNDAIRNKKDYEEDFVEDNFNRMDNLVTSSGQNKTFNITFLGRYLLDVAQKLDVDENIQSKMTVEYENDDGGKKELVYMVNA